MRASESSADSGARHFHCPERGRELGGRGARREAWRGWGSGGGGDGGRRGQTSRQEGKWGEGGREGEDHAGGERPGRGQRRMCPSLLTPQVQLRPHSAQIPAQTKGWAASQGSAGRMKPDFQRQPCTLGARRGHFSLRQQQRGWRCCLVGGHRGRGRRRGRPPAQVERRGSDQHLPLEPGPCAHPCGRAVSCFGSPQLPRPQPCPALGQISVPKAGLPLTCPHAPPLPFTKNHAFLEFRTFQTHFLHTLPPTPTPRAAQPFTRWATAGREADRHREGASVVCDPIKK